VLRCASRHVLTCVSRCVPLTSLLTPPYLRKPLRLDLAAARPGAFRLVAPALTHASHYVVQCRRAESDRIGARRSYPASATSAGHPSLGLPPSHPPSLTVKTRRYISHLTLRKSIDNLMVVVGCRACDGNWSDLTIARPTAVGPHERPGQGARSRGETNGQS
jgi:hypothetical protein